MSEKEDIKLNLIDIPDIFKTSINRDYFKTCLICEKDLIEMQEEYLIEKIYSKGKVEIEYAICIDCLQKERENLSEESLRKVNEFFESYEKKINDRNEFLNGNTDFKKYISNCLISGLEINEEADYHIFAHCLGDKMLLGYFPYALHFEVIDYLQLLLSQKTKDELDNFRKKYFDLPPDIYDIFNKKRVPLFI